jgi:serine/threonine protein kinase
MVTWSCRLSSAGRRTLERRPLPRHMELIGKYEVLAELGQGAYGRLYRALDRSISRQVAIKVLHSLADPRQQARFQREAAAAGNLHHKNIIAVYDFDVHEGLPFLVMELLEGRDLSPGVAAPRLLLFQAVDIMQQAAQGLQHAHQHGVIHGDVTPSNIWLMPDGTVKIIDFGIARRVQGGDETITRTDSSTGTLLYMAPECLPGSGARPDARSDIFSYGVVYYELITGQHPFVGHEEQDERVIVCNLSINDPPPIQSLAPQCPDGIARVIQRALAKDPERRYPSFRDLLLDVEPVRIDLRRQRAETLIKQVKALSDSHQLEAAQAALDQARELDPAHTEARELHEEIQRQFHLKALAQQEVISWIQKAKAMLDERNPTAALKYAQEALRLDPEQTGAHELVARISEDLARAQQQRFRAEILMAKRILSESQFAEAVALLEKLRAEFAESPEIPPLLAYGREELRKQERARTIEQACAQARKHAAYRDFEAAQRLIVDTLRAYPDDPTLNRMLEAVIRAKAASEVYQPAAAAGRPVQEAAGKCTHCQATLLAGMKFCDGCGRPRTAAIR